MNTKMKPVALMIALTLTACGGGGGGGGSSAVPVSSSSSSSSSSGGAVTPLAVQRTSYLNAKNVGALPIALPSHNAAQVAYAVGDFFRDGTLSLVTASIDYCTSYCDAGQTATANAAGAAPGTIKFYKNVNGAWVDRTVDLLSNTTGCVHPRKAAVADVNGDGKPDVILACHGYDAAPFPGESSKVLLSQPNGTYTNTVLPVSGFTHSVTAIDVNGTGFADLIFTDIGTNRVKYYVNNNGTFTLDATRVDISTLTSVFTVEAMDVNGDGKQDLLFSGSELGTFSVPANYPTAMQSTIFLNDGTGHYSAALAKPIPTPDGTYGTIVDVVYTNGYLYLERVIDDPANAYGYYGGISIQKFNPSTNATSVIYNHTGYYQGNPSKWIPWIMPSNGNIVSLDSSFNLSVAQ